MAAEANLIPGLEYVERVKLTVGAAVEPGDVLQAHDGRAAVISGKNDLVSGDEVTAYVTGTFDILATDSIVFREGQPVFWDESANAVHVKPTGTADFPLGTAAEDLASGTSQRLRVNLNNKPHYIAGTGVAGDHGMGTIQEVGAAGSPRVQFNAGWVRLTLDATTEAQTASFLSGSEVPTTDPWMLDFLLEVVDDGDDAALDFVVGVADDDHATDFDSIGTSVFLSLNGNSVNINAESDDTTTAAEVAATDTTADVTLSTAAAPAVTQGLIDARDKDAILIYIDGAAVLTSVTFTLAGSTADLKFFVGAEKTSNNTTADYRVKGGIRRFDLGAAT